MEVERTLSILIEIVATHVDLRLLLVINVNTEHVVLNGTLLVKARDEELSAGILATRRKTDDTSGSEALEVSLLRDCLE